MLAPMRNPMSASTQFKTAVLLALASLAVLKLGALEVCTAGRCHALAFDAELLTQLQAWRTPTLDGFFAAVTWAGSLYLLLPWALLLAVIDKHEGDIYRRCFVALALLSHWPVIHAAKLLVARPRPSLFEPLIALPSDGSFPSAHAAQITAFACACLLRPARRPSPLVAIALIVTVLTVALSRLYLQVHYPSDVLFALGATLLWVLALRYAVIARDLSS